MHTDNMIKIEINFSIDNLWRTLELIFRSAPATKYYWYYIISLVLLLSTYFYQLAVFNNSVFIFCSSHVIAAMGCVYSSKKTLPPCVFKVCKPINQRFKYNNTHLLFSVCIVVVRNLIKKYNTRSNKIIIIYRFQI